MEKKEKLGNFFSKTGKVAKSLLDNAAQAIDQNDDGKLDIKDVGIVATAVGDAVKKGTQSLKDFGEDQKKKFDLGRLNPLFIEELNSADFSMTKFIRVTERDRDHSESEVCQGSIGHLSSPKGLPMVNIYYDSIDSYDLVFFPDRNHEFYYVDPVDRNRYIALDEYFSYLKEARINELECLAQSLGAKHFRVTYKEEKASFSKKKTKSSLNANQVGEASYENDSNSTQYSLVDIAAESYFEGGIPEVPELKYMEKYPGIQSLITMRMSGTSKLQKKIYKFKMMNSCGISKDDAVKIDAALKDMDCAGEISVTSEAMNETRRELEYEIDF